MKNKQGFLPHKLNKYAIRKFTAGTASLLIGATLVFGAGNVARADELDNASAQNSDGNKDKSEPVDITELTNSNETNSTETSATDKTATQTDNANSDQQTTTTNKDVEEKTTNNTGDKQSTEQANSDNVSSDKTSAQESSSIEQNTIDNSNKKASTTKDESTTESATSENKTTSTDDKQVESNKDDESINKQDSETNSTSKENQTSDKTTSDKTSSEKNNTADKTSTKNVDKTTSNKTTSKTEGKTTKATTKNSTSKQDTKKVTTKKATDKTSTKKTESSKKETTSKNSSKSTKTNKTTAKETTELTKQLAKSKNKEKAVQSFLNDQVSTTEAKEILKNTDVDFNKATDEEINQAVLQAALKEMVDKQKSTETLATQPRTRTFMRAMATPRMLAAAVSGDEKAQKSLNYSDNYTFASLVFDPEALDSDAVKNSTSIPFNIHAYMSGSNSGSRYKIDLNLDSKIADHVTKISVNQAGGSNPVTFTRLKNDDGTPSNIWEINYIRANGGLFGGAEILANKTAAGGQIELDDTVENILNEAGDLSNNKLNYQIYVRDSSANTIVRSSESSGYFLTSTDDDLVKLNNNTSTANSKDFKASSGTAILDTKVGDNGAIIVDQQIVKNGTFGYGGASNKQWSYNYQIDKDLIPFIQSVELDRYDYNGLNGFNKTYNASNKVADLSIRCER